MIPCFHCHLLHPKLDYGSLHWLQHYSVKQDYFYTPVLLPHDKDEHGCRFLKYAVLTPTAAAVHLQSWCLPYFLLLSALG